MSIQTFIKCKEIKIDFQFMLFFKRKILLCTKTQNQQNISDPYFILLEPGAYCPDKENL